MLILWTEVRAAIASCNSGKQPGEDNVPTKLLKDDGEDVIHEVCPTMCWRLKCGQMTGPHLYTLKERASSAMQQLQDIQAMLLNRTSAAEHRGYYKTTKNTLLLKSKPGSEGTDQQQSRSMVNLRNSRKWHN